MATRSWQVPRWQLDAASGIYLDVIPVTNVDEKANIGDSFIILCRLVYEDGLEALESWTGLPSLNVNCIQVMEDVSSASELEQSGLSLQLKA